MPRFLQLRRFRAGPLERARRLRRSIGLDGTARGALECWKRGAPLRRFMGQPKGELRDHTNERMAE
jgi:hypothetical protein